MTPAQDATALADQRAADILMEQLDALGAHITYTACKAIVSKLRATSQTPDAVDETLADCIEAAELRGRSLDEIFTPRERRVIAASLRAKPSAGREVVGWRTLNGVDETWKFKPVVDQAFVDQLRARADCIRATNFVHIGEQDARDFAALFDKAADALAHPQPQQADGREAVIEAVQPFVKAFREAKERGIRYNNVTVGIATDMLSYQDFDRLERALQQSPATEPKP